MRLVIDGQRLGRERTGVGRCLESLLDDWSASGWPLDRAILALRDAEALDRFSGRAGLETVLVGPREPGLAWEMFGLRGILRRHDLLFAPANLSPPNWNGTTVLIAYDTLPWAEDGGIPWRARCRFGWRYRLAARRAAHVIVPSRATADDVNRVHGVPASRLTVLHPAVEPGFTPLAIDSEEARAARSALGLGGEPYFLFVGKRSKRRNVGAILAAFERIRECKPSVKLVFVGPGGGRGRPSRAGGVIEGGHVSEPVLRGLLSGAVALMYPSNHEGFGLPVVEAQASGCPVITLRKSALVESGGDAALYVAAPEAGLLAVAMKTLLDDASSRAILVERGLANARRFDRARFAGGVKDIIEETARLQMSPRDISEDSPEPDHAIGRISSRER